MARWSTSFFLFLSFTTGLCLHLIREKGSKTTITCHFKKSETNTVWQVKAGKEFVNVSSCTFASSSCVNNIPDRYSGEVLNVPDGFQSNLIISKVRANETHFKCLGKYEDETNNLEVYTQPKNPSCDPVDVDATKKHLVIKCRAKHVHPSLGAALTIRGVVLSHQDVSVHCKNEKHDPLNHDGHSAECVIRIKAGKLEPATYSYYVTMYPHLSNTSGIKVPVAVTEDYTLALSIPKVSIDEKHCSVGPAVVDGHVIPQSKASCRCVLEEQGFPPARAEWMTHYSRFRTIDDPLNGSSIIIIFRDYPDQRYECRTWSPLKETRSYTAVYLPVFEAPSEPASVGVEIAVGIVVCLVALAAIVAVVVWKWRIRRRQQADAISISYSKPSTESGAEAEKPETTGDYDKLLH